MDAEQHAEWQALRNEAHAALCAGDWMLRLGVFPAFHAPEVIGIGTASRRVVRDRKLRSETLHQLRSRRWSLAEDAEKVRTPVERLRHPRQLIPTIVTRSVFVERELIQQYTSPLASISIPAFPMCEAAGTDGVSYTLFTTSFSHTLELRWWHDHPEQWRPLMAWFDQTRKRLTSILDSAAEVVTHNSQDESHPARNEQ